MKISNFLTSIMLLIRENESFRNLRPLKDEGVNVVIICFYQRDPFLFIHTAFHALLLS